MSRIWCRHGCEGARDAPEDMPWRAWVGVVILIPFRGVTG